MTRVKICGITNHEALFSVIENGADFVGFVFAENSPRTLSSTQAAALWDSLSEQQQDSIRSVGLFVNPSIDQIHQVIDDIQLHMIQLHGNESPAFVSEVKNATDLPVIKALRIETAQDLKQIKQYQNVSDWLLLDSKVEGLQGGTGHSFDWSLLNDIEIKVPWMLAGGLHPGNVALALSQISPDAVDVSSGVESSAGVKSPQKIADFIAAAKQTG